MDLEDFIKLFLFEIGLAFKHKKYFIYFVIKRS